MYVRGWGGGRGRGGREEDKIENMEFSENKRRKSF